MTKTTLWKPAGPEEWELIEKTGMKAFPPRLPEQPTFYPVTTENDAMKIARDWNVKASGCGFVTQFDVANDDLSQYEVQETGGRAHSGNWITAEDLSNFNAAIVGKISATQEFGKGDTSD